LLLGIGSAAAQNIGPSNAGPGGGIAPGKGGGGGSGTVTTGTTNAIAKYSSNGTTVAPVASANSSVLATDGSGNPGLVTTLPTGLTIPAPTMTGTTTTAGISDTGGVNTTATYQLQGSTVINLLNAGSGNTVLAAGVGACAAMDSASNFALCVGDNALHSYSGDASSEHVMIGPGAGYSLVSPSIHDVGTGVYAMNHETTGSNLTCMGGDCMRNSIGVTSGSAFGSRAGQDYFGQQSSFVGANAGYGNGGSITISGTITTSDVIQLTFTSTAISGGASTASYTVGAGNTLAQIAQGLVAAITANSTLLAADVRAVNDGTASPNTITMAYPGTSAIGTTLTVTNTSSGISETITITGGVTATATRNNAHGYDAEYFSGATSASFNNAFGAYVLANLTTGSHNNCMGDLACAALTTSTFVDVVGDQSLKVATTAFAVSALGDRTLETCSTCHNVTAIGSSAGITSITTGSNITIISDGNACDTASVNLLQMCSGGGVYLTVTGTNTASTAKAMLSGSLLIGSTTALTMANGELGLTKVTASGSAPGATGLKLSAVCGTAGGSLKIIAYAGTSTTPTTIIDSVGSGVTGC
jgi:hypothetical protein